MQMIVLSKLSEEALRIILDKYQKSGNTNYEIEIDSGTLPDHIAERIDVIADELKSAGLISDLHFYISGMWDVLLLPDALAYFEEQDTLVQATMPNALPSNAERLLREILDADNPAPFMYTRLRDSNPTERKELRGVLGELHSRGYIEVAWSGNGEPYYIQILNPGRTYFERRTAFLRQAQKQANQTANVYNITGSNVVFGNAVNSQLSIDNSISEIEKRIDAQGGNEKEELKELLAEVKDVVENMKNSGQVTKNTGLFKRLDQHLQKHGWFYTEIVALLGSATLMKMGGQL